MIYWQCSVCGENLEAPDELIGDVVQCPSCKLSNKVPDDIPSSEIAIEIIEELPLPYKDNPVKGQIECPYCSELIMNTAKKCRHCGEWLDEGTRKNSGPWDKGTSDARAVAKGIKEKEPSIFLFKLGIFLSIIISAIAGEEFSLDFRSNYFYYIDCSLGGMVI